MNSKGIFTALIAMMVLSIVISNFFFVQVRNTDVSMDMLRATAGEIRKEWVNARVVYGLVASDAMSDKARNESNCNQPNDYYIQVQSYLDVAKDFMLNNYGIDCAPLISKNLAKDKCAGNAACIASADTINSDEDFYIVLTCQRNGVVFADNFRLRKIVTSSGSPPNCKEDVTDAITGILEVDDP